MLREKEFYKGKKVIVRVDYNVPIENGVITDNTRIVESLKTINYLIEGDAKLILLSHLGRVKKEEDLKNNSLFPVSVELPKLINKEVKFSDVTRGEKLEVLINNLSDGDVLLVQNTRFEDFPNNLESGCDDELSKYWASLGETYVMDAFGSMHREHASTYGIPKILGGNTGFLVDKELSMLENILKDENKIIILGGAKIGDKLGVIESLINKSKKIIIGGGMSYTFLKAKGFNIGKSLLNLEKLEYAKSMLDKYGDKLVLPIDVKTDNGIKDVDKMNDEDTGFDIGPKTRELFKSIIKEDDFVVWNGPMGMFEVEAYEKGTKDLLEYLSKNKIKTVIAGGDTGNAAKKYNLDFYYISTGGGATLEYLEGKRFKTLEVLSE